MIKKFIIYKTILTMLLIAGSASAALQWDVAAFIWTGSAIAVTALSMGTAAPIIALATAGSVGFHAGVVGLYWNDINPPTNSSNQATPRGVSVVLDPNTPLTTPATWTTGNPQDIATNPNLEPKPPLVSNEIQDQGFYRRYTPTNLTVQSSDWSIIHDQMVSQMDTQTRNLAVSGGTQTITRTNPRFNNVNNSFEVTVTDCHPLRACITSTERQFDQFSAFQIPTCKSGYARTINARVMTCNLTNENLVQKPKDEICEMRVKVGRFTNMRNDPDCSGNLITGSNTNQLQAVTPEKAIYLVASTTGDISVFEKTFNQAINKTITAISNFGADQNISYLQTVNSVGNQVAINPALIHGSNGNDGTGTGGGTGVEGAATDGKLDDIFKDGTIADKNFSDTGASTENPFTEFFNPLKNFQVPQQAGVCPAPTLNIFDNDYIMDAHCTIFDENKSVIQTASTLAYLILALTIVLSA